MDLLKLMLLPLIRDPSVNITKIESQLSLTSPNPNTALNGRKQHTSEYLMAMAESIVQIS